MPKGIPQPEFIIKEPINYDALASAYVLAEWRWGTEDYHHHPTAHELLDLVESFKRDVMQKGSTGYISSGGIKVRLVSGKPVISIPERLHKHYANLPSTTSPSL